MSIETGQPQIVIGRPKTRRGERKNALYDQTIAHLKQHQIRQRSERRLIGAPYKNNDLVFAREDGRPVHPDYFSQTFDRTAKRLGLPKIRLHDLRDTCATLGLAAGVPVKVISDRLGHVTSSSTRDVYCMRSRRSRKRPPTRSQASCSATIDRTLCIAHAAERASRRTARSSGRWRWDDIRARSRQFEGNRLFRYRAILYLSRRFRNASSPPSSRAQACSRLSGQGATLTAARRLRYRK